MRLLPMLLLLAGCATTGAPVEVLIVDESTAPLRAKVPVLPAGAAGQVIQPLRALSCKTKMWDAEPSEADAIAQLQIKASRLGANGLANLRCVADPTTSLRANCWQSVACQADAIKTP